MGRLRRFTPLTSMAKKTPLHLSKLIKVLPPIPRITLRPPGIPRFPYVELINHRSPFFTASDGRRSFVACRASFPVTRFATKAEMIPILFAFIPVLSAFISVLDSFWFFSVGQITKYIEGGR